VGYHNLFLKINDLAGFRILHLHTRQMDHINKPLLKRFDEALYRLIEGPVAKTWDEMNLENILKGSAFALKRAKRSKRKKNPASTQASTTSLDLT
jgi:hypothetical protein